ncbi:MAG: FAD-binding protein [Streptosporangiaceae bacterium]
MPFTEPSALVPVVTAGAPGWDEARRAWDLAADQRPAAIAVPATAQDVVAAVGAARRRGLRISAQGTGHGAAALGPLEETLLVRTSGMRGIRVDPAAMTAQVQAGVTWQEVAETAAAQGLAALAACSPDVGVVGYTLGGGIGWLGRSYGLSANNVEAFEVVTADGRLVRADVAREPDLFWALRGGGGSFGVVTAAELRLYPITEVYAGLLLWPAAEAPEVLAAWRELTSGDLPDEFTTAVRLMSFPAVPGIPAVLHGRSAVVVYAVHLGLPGEADALLAPLRALRPEKDTVRTIPITALGRVHLDPEGPTPYTVDGLLLAGLPAAAIDQIIAAAPPEGRSPLVMVEVLHLGGELARARPHSGALAAVDAPYLLLAGGLTATPQLAATVATGVRDLQAAVSDWEAPQRYLNLARAHADPARFWSPDAYHRLRRVKAAVDPLDLIRGNHPVPPA